METGTVTETTETGVVDTGALESQDTAIIIDAAPTETASADSMLETGVAETGIAETGIADTAKPDTGTAEIGTTCGGGTATAADVSVNLSDVLQNISGFGASTAWGSAFANATDPDTLWSTTTGAGLSLHRIRIDPNGGTSEVNIAKAAVARGVTIWATPWTPPAPDKDNSNIVMGHLSNPAMYATTLVNFVKNMKNQGINIYAVSAQNEPDANVTYESCVYSPAQMTTWVGQYMGPAFANTGVKVMSPETQNWCGFKTFEPAMIGDTATMKYVSIVATHEYGCNPSAYPAIAAAGKEFWETEIYDLANTTDLGIGSGLRVAKLIHDALTIASMNAWHYWWVYGSGNGGLYDSGAKQWSKRLWVEGNYARFVRPGYKRVGTSGTVPAGVLLSAYTNASDGTVVVVAINNNTSATPVSLVVSGAAPCSVTPWVTSSSDSLASKPAVSVTKSRFLASLGPQSVTTLVGKP